MKVGSIFNYAVQGIQRGLNGAQRNAAEIASAKQMRGEADPTRPLVELQQNRLQVEANVKVARTADQMLGSLFDEQA